MVPERRMTVAVVLRLIIYLRVLVMTFYLPFWGKDSFRKC